MKEEKRRFKMAKSTWKRLSAIGLVLVLLVTLVTGTAGPRAVQAATIVEIEQAIVDGLAWLASEQNPDGGWSGYEGTYGTAVTCMILVKFQDRAYELGYESPFDPAYEYSQTVVDGWTYVFSPTLILSQTLSVQPAGDPDTNGNGYGVYTYDESGNVHFTYGTGVCLMALAASKTPERPNEGGLDFDDNGSPDTYLEIAQDMTDWLAFAQADDPGIYRGGWNYDACDNYGDDADESNSGFAVLGLAYGEDFGIVIPDWVKSELSIWIDAVMDPVDGDQWDGCAWYEPCPGPCGWNPNIYKQGHLLNQLIFIGDTPGTSQRVEDALQCTERLWREENIDPGWGYNVDPPASYLGMYSIMKGFGYAGIDLIDTDGDGMRDDDWYNQEPPQDPPQDFATVLVAQQNASGSWPASCEWGNGNLCTVWALFTLERIFPMAQMVDLSIAKSDDPDPALASSTLVYTLDVANEGGVDATGVTVTDTLPTEVFFVDAAPSQGTCNESAGIVVCDLGDMASEANATILITNTINPLFTGVFTNTAVVEANEEDLNPIDNIAFEDTTVETAFYYIPDVKHVADIISSIQVVNIGDTDSLIRVHYYHQDGTEDVVSPVEGTILAGESLTYFPIDPEMPFDGSAVIEYTGEVAAISNFFYLDPAVLASYHGFPTGGPTLVLPLIMTENNYNDSTFNIQNTTGQPVDILIEFIPEPGMGYADTIPDVTDTLPPWSAHTYDQRTMASFAGVGQWVGSARVTVQGQGAIAGVAQQLDSARSTGTAYTGFLEGASVVDLPLIMDNNNAMWTSINCQNLGPGETDIGIEFFPEVGYPAKAPEIKDAIAENGTAVFLQSPYADQWVGSARVTADNSLACVVNQLNLDLHYASAYQGFDPTKATDLILAPLVQYQDQGDGMNLWTGVNIMNLGATATTVTMDFKPSAGYADIPAQTVDIEPGAVGVFLFYDPYGDGSSAIGGAEIFCTAGTPLAVVVNQAKLGFDGDVYSTYNAFAR
jgi:uncharacterized repeat protein (TIGR01451 family)